MGLGIRGWRRVGLGLCKVGGVGSRSNSAPWILCSAVRTIWLLRSQQDMPSTRGGGVKDTSINSSVALRYSIYLFVKNNVI